MSRRNISKKRFPEADLIYNNYLVSFLIARILKSGKKNLAKNIVYQAFNIIKKKTKKNPLKIFKKAIQNTSPVLEVKAKKIGGSTYQVPIQVEKYRALNLSLRWLIQYSRKRSGKNMAIKLANEILDAADNFGNSIKKKEETHKMAEMNKGFAHFGY